MPKSTTTYWNVLAGKNRNRWETVAGTAGAIEQITVAIDPETKH